jgi:hypothetical protein
MKKRIKGLEEEKERLSDKVAKAKAQVEKIADRSNYMDVCSALRKQQDEEVNLSTQMLVREKGGRGVVRREEEVWCGVDLWMICVVQAMDI